MLPYGGVSGEGVQVVRVIESIGRGGPPQQAYAAAHPTGLEASIPPIPVLMNRQPLSGATAHRVRIWSPPVLIQATLNATNARASNGTMDVSVGPRLAS